MICGSTPGTHRSRHRRAALPGAGIPPVLLSPAETGRLLDLARDHEHGRLPLARLAFHLRWSTWGRRHQARARWHHYAARLSSDPGRTKGGDGM